MKFISTSIFCLIAIFSQAQNVSYSVECPKSDSCFLKEVVSSVANDKAPRPQVTTTYTLFRSLDEYDAIIAAIRKQASEDLTKGMDIVDKARMMSAVADKIQAVRPKK